MAIEYTLDPEDDVTGHLSNIYRKQYEYRSIIQKCVNTGDVAGKRSYVGGIVGRMDLGYLTACETSSCTITKRKRQLYRRHRRSHRRDGARELLQVHAQRQEVCRRHRRLRRTGKCRRQRQYRELELLARRYHRLPSSTRARSPAAIRARLSTTTMSPTIFPASTVRAIPGGPSPSAMQSFSRCPISPRA